MVVVAFGAAVLAALYVAVVLLRGAAVKPTFSREYRQNVTMANPYWRELRRNTFALTRGRDVLLPFLRAEQLIICVTGATGETSSDTSGRSTTSCRSRASLTRS